MQKDNKLKVLVMTNEYLPKIIGGLGIVATHLSRALSQNGVEVTVLCAGNSNQLTISKPNDNLRILRFPKSTRYFHRTKQSFKAKAILNTVSSKGFTKPDIIHVHSTDFADTAKLAKARFQVPIVYSCHSMVSQGALSAPGKNQTKLIHSASRIIVPSKWQIDATRRRYPHTNINKFSVIPHGVEPGTSQSEAAPTNLLYVGRLIPSKGADALIRAIGLLSRTHKDVRLTIVGSGLISYQRKIRALTRQMGLTKRIRWVKKSKYEAVQRMYTLYGAVIVPSTKESFCLVALEAMANGVPLISTLSGGLKEFVNDQNAQIISTVTSPDIARAIKAFWNNPSLTKNRVHNARSTAARYNWSSITLQYESLFTNLNKVEGQ
ncbi:glycosyl transferase family 1 [Brevibacillus brevis]|uniref:glycosyltransferase family 4 protein n=1 Tax=Brevibacillus brevis TaxID=1393 RepID=UPI0019018158|nr:glycosyltransferase family 4 protein [Brevibacillus brevis]MBH0330979.1 glycosyl transferase family 1 [Brevibacillus brevis]